MDQQEEQEDPVALDETWYRHILTPSEVDYVPDNGLRLHPKFFENKFKAPQHKRDWQLEISGRLLSKAGSIRDFADKKLEGMPHKKKAFHGIIKSRVEDIRQIPPIGNFDVKSTPLDEDAAHADLVSFDSLVIDGIVSAEKTAGLRDHFRLVAENSPDFPPPHNG